MNKSYQHLTGTDLQRYLDSYPFTSRSQQNQLINALKFLYEKGLNKKYQKVDFTRPRKQTILPQPIEKYYLQNRIQNIPNLKHKAIISLAYSTGMRSGEIIRLKIQDINSTFVKKYIEVAAGILQKIQTYRILIQWAK